ncbi:MAG TPA: hypothetical protein VFZ34_30025 [Blastocatellia bacterium]|nr:hypothetical protein [Blastocatellia bacterium]
MFRLLFTAMFCLLTLLVTPQLIAAQSQPTTEEPQLTVEQMKAFLLSAKVIKEKQTPKGVTAPSRLTLSDGVITHDAGFQTIDESKQKMDFQTGGSEVNFRDSYKYNIAAYELACMLGLSQMMPVTVERKLAGKTGSLTWWLKVQMDEADRMKKKIDPPYKESWNEQMHRIRVFTQLVFDMDRNLTNLLIGPNWELYMIDFTRAFRLHHQLKNEKDLVRCDRRLLEKLRTLDGAQVKQALQKYLNSYEIKAIMMRRDKIVAHFDKLVAQKGDKEVLY